MGSKIGMYNHVWRVCYGRTNLIHPAIDGLTRWICHPLCTISGLLISPFCSSLFTCWQKTYALKSTDHIDRDIFKNMLSFTCFKDKAELIAALLSEE